MIYKGAEVTSWGALPMMLKPWMVKSLIGEEDGNTLRKLAEAGLIERTPKPVNGSYKYPRWAVQEYCEREGIHPFKK
ncbi:MAG: hypothetical protein K9K66_04390 [Desulfarculaceae bacterium]|nr:hypothetical protein [Desulfarculaceae bacterium]MCF8073282.1 hypothetical protein [Desulfarculaceae bacterium]MCF8100878.1 hypothetical protein [Desulfarculaceae bacterium]MCF8116666.1 hypothetical protein [Desulfarculaceae bacterium]